LRWARGFADALLPILRPLAGRDDGATAVRRTSHGLRD